MKKQSNDFQAYQEAVAFVEGFSYRSIRRNAVKKAGDKIRDPNFFLKRTQHFLDLIGNPEKGMKVIHITGTAGKGTVSTMTQEVLNAARELGVDKDGKKSKFGSVGLFTSPYVTTTIEKIKVDDQYISPEEFVQIVNHIKPYIPKAEKSIYGIPSAFELFVVLSLLYFKRRKCEWAVLEVGLGGRYDATNIITNPAVTAITNIDYDHTDILGKTLREIAYDKAGIIKKGSLFFTSEQMPSLQAFFKKTCKSVGVEFASIKRQKNYSDYNKELVRAIARSAAVGASEESIERGIAKTKLPCRFEIMQQGVQGKPTVILDGAHNRAKIRSTISNLSRLYGKDIKLHFLVAISDTKKDNQAILEPLLSVANEKRFVFTQLKTEERKSVAPQFLLKTAKALMQKMGAKKSNAKKTAMEIIEDPKTAIIEMQKTAKEDDVVIVVGSFFLAGEVRKLWYPEDWVLKKRKSFR